MPLTRRTASRPPATKIAVTSGKGGVGKTSLTVNLAVAMARLGHRVAVLDADFSLGNIDVMLGLTPEAHLGSVLTGEKTVSEITLEGPSGIRIIPAGSGVRTLTAITGEAWDRLVTAIDDVSQDVDFLLIDTATGISDNVLDVIGLSDYVLVVTSFEPAAVVDAYAVIKLISAGNAQRPIGVVVNTARDADEGHLVFRQISLAAERFLHRSLRYDGHVLEDRSVKDSTLAQMALVGTGPAGPASRDIRRIAARLTAARPSGAGPWPAKPTVVSTRPGASVEAPQCA